MNNKNNRLAARIDAREGIARIDMATGLAGIFRPRCGRSRLYVEGRRQKWCGGTIRIAGPELDSGDLLLLLVLLRIGTEGQVQAGSGPGLIPGGDGAQPVNAAKGMDSIRVETTIAEIARGTGVAGDGRDYARLRASLRRLAGIVVEIEADDRWGLTHLISAAGISTGKLIIHISGRLTKAILGSGSFGQITVDHARRLTPVARVLLVWISCWFGGARGARTVNVNKLAEHVWGAASIGSTARRRRQMVKSALDEIRGDSHWDIVIDGQRARIEWGKTCS